MNRKTMTKLTMFALAAALAAPGAFAQDGTTVPAPTVVPGPALAPGPVLAPAPAPTAITLPEKAGDTAMLESSGKDVERAYRYKLKALGANAGEVVMTIKPQEKVGNKKVRALQMNARTEGLAAKILKTNTASTSWVDDRWLPVRARWETTTNGVKRLVKTKYANKVLTSVDERDGKVFAKPRHRTKYRPADLISIFPWLMQQDMSPGTEYAIDVFDGRRIYRLDITVGTAKDIHLPIGIRKAIELRAKVSRGSYKREMKLWISADEDRTPYKLSFKYGLLGKVEATIVGTKKG